MQSFVDGLAGLDFDVLLWGFLAVTVLHELEEWNINAFERRYFSGVPEYATPRSARGVIAFVSIAVLIVSAAAALTGDPAAAWLFLPAVFFMVTNAFQHLYWTVRFRRYAPGVATALALVVPLGLYLVVRAVADGHVPALYAALLALVSAAVWVHTVRAGDHMTPFVRGAYAAGDRITGRRARASER